MKRTMALSVVICGSLLFAWVAAAPAADAAWSDAVRLDNGVVELTAAASIARVTHFALKGKPNVFRLDKDLMGQSQNRDMDATGQYKDFGGAKLWVAPQSQWGTRSGNWPPHYEIDSAPCRLERSGTGSLTLIGQPSRAAGVAFTRTISLKGPAAEVEVVMTNVSEKPVAWGIWTVACVRPGGTVFLPWEPGAAIWSADKEHSAPEKYGWKRFADTLMLEQAAAKDGCKFFSKSKAGWIGSVNEGQALLITFHADPAAPLPAGEGSAEVYSCKKFVELEHVGRRESLKPGERAVLKEQWHLFPAPPAGLTAAETGGWMSAKAATLPR